MFSRTRPEHKAPPEVFYDEKEAQKYTVNSRMIEIQTQMCERAIELLLLPEDETCFLLDLGCGSGLSGGVLEEHGHYWVGVDISRAMLGPIAFQGLVRILFKHEIEYSHIKVWFLSLHHSCSNDKEMAAKLKQSPPSMFAPCSKAH